jgi:hypothetical protein
MGGGKNPAGGGKKVESKKGPDKIGDSKNQTQRWPTDKKHFAALCFVSPLKSPESLITLLVSTKIF